MGGTGCTGHVQTVCKIVLISLPHVLRCSFRFPALTGVSSQAQDLQICVTQMTHGAWKGPFNFWLFPVTPPTGG
jgi:hypothetical protein